MKSLIQVLFFVLFLTQISFAQWVQVGLADEEIQDIAVRNTTIFATTTDTADTQMRGVVYRSTDNGSNWQQVVESRVIDIDLTPTGDVFMIRDSLSGSRELFASSDAGINWQYINIIEQLDSIDGILTSISVSPSGIVFCGFWKWNGGFHGGYSTGLATSTDNGLNWTSPGWICAGELYDFKYNVVLTYGSCSGFLTAPWSTFNLSSDEGTNWDWTGDTHEFSDCTALSFFSNQYVDIGLVIGIPNDPSFPGNQGLFLSIDSCQSWMRVSTLSISTGLSLESNYMLVGTDSLGVFLFFEGVDSLGSFNEGLSNLNIHTITIDESNNLYIGTDDGLWRRPLSEIVVSAEEISNKLPSSFNLSQNYPNPFNSATAIQYSVKERTQVELVVYDILGREVEILVNGEQDAGHYKVNFNAGNLASGIYLYRLKAGSFIETKKMLLLK
jgi:hypothetical protein